MAVSSGTILRVVASILFPDNVIAQNVFYWVVTDLATSDDEVDVVSDIEDRLEAIYEAADNTIDSTMTADEVVVYEYDAVDDDWDEIGSKLGTWVFSGTSEVLPHGVAAVSTAKTLDPDVDGRKFWPGIVEGAQDDSILAAAHVQNIADMGALWVTGFTGAATGGTFTPGVWSTVGTVFKVMSGTIITNTILGYQRRRKPGVGI